MYIYIHIYRYKGISNVRKKRKSVSHGPLEWLDTQKAASGTRRTPIELLAVAKHMQIIILSPPVL